jgi:hypothetical protein
VNLPGLLVAEDVILPSAEPHPIAIPYIRDKH